MTGRRVNATSPVAVFDTVDQMREQLRAREDGRTVFNSLRVRDGVVVAPNAEDLAGEWSRSRTPRDAPCPSAIPESCTGFLPGGWVWSSNGFSTSRPTTAIRRSVRSFARRCCRMRWSRRAHAAGRGPAWSVRPPHVRRATWGPDPRNGTSRRSKRTGPVFLESHDESVPKILQDGEAHSGRRPDIRPVRRRTPHALGERHAITLTRRLIATIEPRFATPTHENRSPRTRMFVYHRSPLHHRPLYAASAASALPHDNHSSGTT